MTMDPQVPAGAASADAQQVPWPRAAGAEAAEVVARPASSVVVEVREVRTLGHAVRAVPGVLARVTRRRTLHVKVKVKDVDLI